MCSKTPSFDTTYWKYVYYGFFHFEVIILPLYHQLKSRYHLVINSSEITQIFNSSFKKHISRWGNFVSNKMFFSIFLMSTGKHKLCHTLEAPHRGVTKEYHYICVCGGIRKKTTTKNKKQKQRKNSNNKTYPPLIWSYEKEWPSPTD